MTQIGSFDYSGIAARVIFGAGRVSEIADEVRLAGAKAALVLCTQEQTEVGGQVADLLGDLSVGVYDRAVMHVPIAVAEGARDHARDAGADCYIAVGGGSTIGLAKAIALTSAQPVIAIPTTFAGSEMTPVWGLTEDGVKKTGRDSRVLPRTVIYDADLLSTLPLAMAGPSALNAIAHCVEAMYAVDGNPIISLLSEEGIAALAAGLPALHQATNPQHKADALSQLQYGAWLAGTALNGASMALHHKLCHTLGGTFNLPHAQTHTVILPYAAAYNASHAKSTMERIARAMKLDKASEVPNALKNLATASGSPTSLGELGMTKNQLDTAADLAAANAYANPRPIDRDGIYALLERALDGLAPIA